MEHDHHHLGLAEHHEFNAWLESFAQTTLTGSALFDGAFFALVFALLGFGLYVLLKKFGIGHQKSKQQKFIHAFHHVGEGAIFAFGLILLFPILHSLSSDSQSWVPLEGILLVLFLSFLGQWVWQRLGFKSTCPCDHDCHSAYTDTLAVLAITLHAAQDGFLLAALFLTGRVGIPFTLIVLAHKIPVAFLVRALLDDTSWHYRWWWQGLFLFSTPVALFLGYGIGESIVTTPSISFVLHALAGGLALSVGKAIFPIRRTKFIPFLCGVGIMFLISFFGMH